MTTTRDTVLTALRMTDPFAGFDAADRPLDLSGWGSTHPYLTDTLERCEAPVVVDVGVWKGGSTITMASVLAERGQGVVLSVDTFLGSVEHYLNDEWRGSLAIEHGRPQLYLTFITNVVRKRLESFVIPLPLDATNAALLLARTGVRPDIVHVDASHDYESVAHDVRVWFEVLAPGGTMICDDYTPEWPGVVQAVDVFRSVTEVLEFEATLGKCRFRKPADTVSGSRAANPSLADLQVGALAAERDRLRSERDELSTALRHALAGRDAVTIQCRDAEARVEAITHSLSWRVTAWLRRLDLRRFRR